MSKKVSFSILIFLLLISGFILWFSYEPLILEDITSWPTSPIVLDRYGHISAVRLSTAQEWSMPIPLKRMNSWLPKIAVAVEDRRFSSHHGVDTLALCRALFQNVLRRRVVSGASTISSQVIRLSTPRPRTIRCKITEFLQAMQLERRLDKKGIMEIYLNRAPLGGNLRGVQAASLSWFAKEARDLSLAESALLIGMLKGPSFYDPLRHPERARERRDAILKDLLHRGLVPEKAAKMALREPLPLRRRKMPDGAFHFTEFVLKTNEARGGTFTTTLDPEIQEVLERALREGLTALPEGVTAAGAVAENGTGAIRAYVGNATFGTNLPGSWIDCCLAPRSPGSTLKPFVYARAFDRGLITPASLLADTPLSLSGEGPRNFDLTYRGPVSARTALAKSLNVPAVRILRMVGGPEFLQALRLAGFAHLFRPSSWYGDSIVLGGCEITPFELLEAYMALANGGEHLSPVFLKGTASPTRNSICSSAAAFLVADILRDRERLLPLQRYTLEEKGFVAAFKTGTSYGFRDAWTAAWNPDFTVIVWYGDTEGIPHSGLVGLRAATPPAMKVLRSISRGRWYEPPENVRQRQVCSLSGRPPGRACPRRRPDLYIENISTSSPCDMHVFKDGRRTTMWPPDLVSFMGGDSSESVRRSMPEIISPRSGGDYYLPPEAKGQKIALRCEGGIGTLFWFVDGVFFGSCSWNGSIFWPLESGYHRISMIDSRGLTAVSTLNVVGEEAIGETPGLEISIVD